MKMVMIAYNEALESELKEAVEAAGLRNFTEVAKVLGKGDTSGPHMGTHVWPKQNNLLFAALDDDVAADVMAAVRRLRETVGHEGVKAFVLSLHDIT